MHANERYWFAEPTPVTTRLLMNTNDFRGGSMQGPVQGQVTAHLGFVVAAVAI